MGATPASVVAKRQGYQVKRTDCFDWLADPSNRHSVHAVVTDPPFGLIEYEDAHLAKRERGSGGVWRIPPRLGGSERKPVPRFTVLRTHEIEALRRFFHEWALAVSGVLVPGGHLIIAGNVLLSPYVADAVMRAGFERRGEVIRIVRTLRGGDRPKLAEKEFPEVSVTPRGCYEPWGLFRKPLEGRTVADNLRRWGTGGLRRIPDGRPFPDVLRSETPSVREESLAPHPSLKPQRLMRQLVWASLPLGEGVVLDPFMGSGSTLAAATALGYRSIGLERRQDFFDMATVAIPSLAALDVDWQDFGL